MRQSIASFILLCVVLYGGLVATVYFAQRFLLFLPTTERVPPQRFGVDRIDEVTLENGANERLYSWYARAAEGRPTFLFFHGNGGNVSHRLHKFRQLMAAGYGVFMLGYPGYGGSDGRPSEPAFVEAATLALAYLDARGIDRADLGVYGESLGSAVAVQLRNFLHRAHR